MKRENVQKAKSLDSQAKDLEMQIGYVNDEKRPVIVSIYNNFTLTEPLASVVRTLLSKELEQKLKKTLKELEDLN